MTSTEARDSMVLMRTSYRGHAATPGVMRVRALKSVGLTLALTFGCAQSDAPKSKKITTEDSASDTAAAVKSVTASSFPITADLSVKPWHTSPNANRYSSTVYPAFAWEVITQLSIGMTTDDAEKLVGPLQFYHHPINAVVYSTNDGKLYEIALKLSDDKKTITDASFKHGN